MLRGKPPRVLLLLVALGAAPRPAAAQEDGPPTWTIEAAEDEPRPTWTIEAALGDAFNFPTRLDIHQLDHPLAILHARYDTRAFELPVYWAVRVARWRGARAWAVELVHHKLHLREPADPVDAFSVSHGFNLLSVARLVSRGDLFGGVAGGAVIAHPENRVRGLELSQAGGIGGFYLAGPTAAVLVGWRRDVWRGTIVDAEARFAASYAHIPIADGHAAVVHLGLHGHIGLGWRITR